MPTRVIAAIQIGESAFKPTLPLLTKPGGASQGPLPAFQVWGSQIKEILPLTFASTSMVNGARNPLYVDRDLLQLERVRGCG